MFPTTLVFTRQLLPRATASKNGDPYTFAQGGGLLLSASFRTLLSSSVKKKTTWKRHEMSRLYTPSFHHHGSQKWIPPIGVTFQIYSTCMVHDSGRKSKVQWLEQNLHLHLWCSTKILQKRNVILLVTSRWILDAHAWHKMHHCQEFPSKPLTGQLSWLRNTTLHHCVWHKKICYKTSCYLSSSPKKHLPYGCLHLSPGICFRFPGLFLSHLRRHGSGLFSDVDDDRRDESKTTARPGRNGWARTPKTKLKKNIDMKWDMLGECTHCGIRDVGRRWPHTWISYPWASLLTPANTRSLASLLANWHYILIKGIHQYIMIQTISYGINILKLILLMDKILHHQGW